MSFNAFIFYAIIFCTVFLLGYAMGRRVGKKEGFVEGMSTSPIEMRRKLLLNSCCPLCQQTLNELFICDNIHSRGD